MVLLLPFSNWSVIGLLQSYVSTGNVWYLVSSQICSRLPIGLSLLFLICISFRSRMSFPFLCYSPGPNPVTVGNNLAVTATCILVFFFLLWPSKPISCYLSWQLWSNYLSIYKQAVYVCQLKSVTTWYHGFHNIFLYIFDAPVLILFPNCSVGSILWSHFHRSTSIHEYLQRSIGGPPSDLDLSV